jgi:hypothetical protein
MIIRDGKGGIELYNPLLDDIFGLYFHLLLNSRCESKFTMRHPCFVVYMYPVRVYY